MKKAQRSFNGLTLGNNKQAKICRKIVKDFYKQDPAPEKMPLLSESRTYADPDDWEGYTEYGFLPNRYDDLPEDALRDLEKELWEYTGCAWDCSGRMFTVSLHLHRNPSGKVSFIHRRAIDI